MVDYIKGIDVSVIQGNIDWQWVANQGIQFAIIRCGVGNGGIDKNYLANVAGAKAAGIKVAAYHFTYPLPALASQPMRDPIKQAQLHFSYAKGELACCDFEWPPVNEWTKWGCSAQQINDWGLAYLAEYSRLDGRKMVFYTYPSFAISVKMTSDYAQYPLWIASYQPNKPWVPAPFTDWVMWQFAGGTAMKLSNNVAVDTNYAKDLSLWGVVSQPVTDPIPDHQPDPAVDHPSSPVTADPTFVPPIAPAAPPVAGPPPVIGGNIFTNIWGAITDLFNKH